MRLTHENGTGAARPGLWVLLVLALGGGGTALHLGGSPDSSAQGREIQADRLARIEERQQQHGQRLDEINDMVRVLVTRGLGRAK